MACEAGADGLAVAQAANVGASLPVAQSVREIAGKGVCASLDGTEILAGSARLLADFGIAHSEATENGSVVYLAAGGEYIGYIALADVIKKDSFLAVPALRAAGVRNLIMLSGDSEATAAAVSEALGLDAYYAGLLPDQKVSKLEEIEAAVNTRGISRDSSDAPADGVLRDGEISAVIPAGNRRTVLFVGDGINDAPVLARADAGVAMGGLGSDAAIEAADAVIMTDEPSKLAAAILIAKKTRAIVRQNIVFALGVKGLLLVLGALGLASMWAAVFGDVGVALIAILNALRAMR
jgi:Cd2+/Zn2+-exporting ATPase